MIPKHPGLSTQECDYLYLLLEQLKLSVEKKTTTKGLPFSEQVFWRHVDTGRIFMVAASSTCGETVIITELVVDLRNNPLAKKQKQFPNQLPKTAKRNQMCMAAGVEDRIDLTNLPQMAALIEDAITNNQLLVNGRLISSGKSLASCHLNESQRKQFKRCIDKQQQVAQAAKAELTGT